MSESRSYVSGVPGPANASNLLQETMTFDLPVRTALCVIYEVCFD